MEKITVVKVGGAIVENEDQLNALLKDFSAIEGKKILVHGGGRRATKVAASLGIESVMIGGRRVTDAKMLEVVTMVYGGLVNKNLVAKLQSNGVNAIGLTGADMDIIRSHKRPLKKMTIEWAISSIPTPIRWLPRQLNHWLLQAMTSPSSTLSRRKACSAIPMMTTA